MPTFYCHSWPFWLAYLVGWLFYPLTSTLLFCACLVTTVMDTKKKTCGGYTKEIILGSILGIMVAFFWPAIFFVVDERYIVRLFKHEATPLQMQVSPNPSPEPIQKPMGLAHV